jgi:hypothetical protein
VLAVERRSEFPRSELTGLVCLLEVIMSRSSWPIRFLFRERSRSSAARTKRRQRPNLACEALELRITPSAGEIHGTLWNDLNGNGIRDTGEPVRPGVTVYLDGNQNGQLDSGESSVLTAADGTYAFTGLTPGNTYQVALEASRMNSTSAAVAIPGSTGAII